MGEGGKIALAKRNEISVPPSHRELENADRVCSCFSAPFVCEMYANVMGNAASARPDAMAVIEIRFRGKRRGDADDEN